MSSCNTYNMDLVEISGFRHTDFINFVAPVTNANPPVVGNIYWKQMYIPQTLTIPMQNPNIEEINSVNVSVNLLRKKVILTPTSCGWNMGGNRLSGRTLLIEGELCQKIIYNACDAEHASYSVNFYVPFSASIVVPLSVTFPSGEVKDSLYVNYEVDTFIEDLSLTLQSPRTFSENLTILIHATPSIDC